MLVLELAFRLWLLSRWMDPAEAEEGCGLSVAGSAPCTPVLASDHHTPTWAHAQHLAAIQREDRVLLGHHMEDMSWGHVLAI